jgi:hypothetical protein
MTREQLLEALLGNKQLVHANRKAPVELLRSIYENAKVSGLL